MAGGTEEIINAYRGPVLDTIANALSWPVEMKIVSVNEEWPNGIIFPVGRVGRDPNSIFPVQEYDWDDIKQRIVPLVEQVILNLEVTTRIKHKQGFPDFR